VAVLNPACSRFTHVVDSRPHELEDLRDASDADGPPLDAAALASLDRGLPDVSEGRAKPLEQYERERGL